MPRRPRVQAPGATYHITARGNDGTPIFRDDTDRRLFVRLVARVVHDLGWRCFAYCLMGNHYHLLIQTPEPDLSRGMHALQSAYVRRFNTRHGRSGHVFGRRFHDQRVERDEHLIAASAYIVLNPVRAGLVRMPEAWRWSSYRATVDARASRASFLDVDSLLSMLSADPNRAREIFREMVERLGARSVPGT